MQGGRGSRIRMRGLRYYDKAIGTNELQELVERSFEEYIIRLALLQLAEKKRVEKRVEKRRREEGESI